MKENKLDIPGGIRIIKVCKAISSTLKIMHLPDCF